MQKTQLTDCPSTLKELPRGVMRAAATWENEEYRCQLCMQLYAADVGQAHTPMLVCHNVHTLCAQCYGTAAFFIANLAPCATVCTHTQTCTHKTCTRLTTCARTRR